MINHWDEPTHERVLTKEEADRAQQKDSIYAISHITIGENPFENAENFNPAANVDRSSKETSKIPKGVLTTNFGEATVSSDLI
jgi:hypothetical protein